MAEFMIRFLICNIFISIIIGIFLLARHLLKNDLTSRMHYNLWFWLIGCSLYSSSANLFFTDFCMVRKP
ncbi:MAG: hypothetical protein K2P59_07455 [Acetatifactor sp.]|nr:hypothetical protein [Acetatifactor sp.]